MYQIRYTDPMTGMVLESSSSNIDEAVAAIKKAKDNLYFKGYHSQEDPKIDSSTEDVAQSAGIIDEDFDSSFSNPEDFWFPYGVTYDT